MDVLAGPPVEQSAEVSGDADREVQGGGGQTDAVADLVDQLQRSASRPVPLVDDGDDGNAAVATHLEQLQSLRLESLGRIDEHHGGIDGREHPVGVLGEIGVTGRVDEVDHIDLVDTATGLVESVVELQCGRAHGDTASLLHLHPVRHGRAPAGFAVDGARFADHPRMQGQRLGHRRLTGVRVRDDRECATAGHLAGHHGLVGGRGFGRCSGRVGTHSEKATDQRVRVPIAATAERPARWRCYSNGTGGRVTTCAA